MITDHRLAGETFDDQGADTVEGDDVLKLDVHIRRYRWLRLTGEQQPRPRLQFTRMSGLVGALHSV